MLKYKIIFMGTPSFAKEVLMELYKHPMLEVVAVVTQPDRMVKKKVIQPEVKKLAQELNLPIFQPLKIKEALQELKQLEAQAIITCAYGQFLPQSVLEATPLGVFNFHASLLPLYRGGAPMEWAVINGENKTGMTIMKSVKKMDAGDIYIQKEVPILETDTKSDVERKLIECSKELIRVSLIDILSNKIPGVTQDESKATFAYTIQSSDELIDFNRPVKQVYNHIRGLIDKPLGYALLDGKRVKFKEVSFICDNPQHLPGTISSFTDKGLVICCLEGSVVIQSMQLEGKEMRKVQDLVNGYAKSWTLKQFNYEN